jgi:acyl-CoA thioester hydrolase
MPAQRFPFRYRVRVRYSEIDSQAVVFNSRYLEYADVALGEFWRSRGIPLTGPLVTPMHVRHVEIDFRKPFRFDEIIDAWVRTAKLGESSVVTEIEFHGADADELRTSIRMVHVCMDLRSRARQPLPDHMRAALA